MAQYPAIIALSGLVGTDGFKISGEAAYDRAGWSVSSAGDINGDGFADVIIGAETSGAGGAVSGASYVVFGAASGFAANLDLSTLNGTNGFKIPGAAAGDYSGQSVSGAGDVNGDGVADFIVGAWAASPHGFRSGASYVVFGKGSGFGASLDLTTLNGANGFRISGVAASEDTGFSVASAGDVNGDGFKDLIVGAPGSSPNGANFSGASYVVFGKGSGFAANLDVTTLNGTNGFKISGAAAIDNSGWSVSGADVNGDGFSDVIIGARYAAGDVAQSGASYVVFGKASGFAANVNLSTLDGNNGFKLSGVGGSDFSGASVSGAGDVNGDGYQDIIIGAKNADPNAANAGASYVVFGKAGGFAANLDLSTLNGTTGFKISGAAGNDYSGHAVAAVGDVNGDGFDDLIIGAFHASGGGNPKAGATYVVFGKAGGFAANLDVSTLDGTNGFKLSGSGYNDYSGFSVSAAGDVNGDGLADLIVGAPQTSPHGGDSGSSYIVFGRLPDAPVNLTGTAASQTLVGGDFGDTIAGGAGDDKLYGHAGNDSIDGQAGNDILYGGAGDDALTGGSGLDTASYLDAPSAVTVSLAILIAQNTVGAGNDTLSGIENLTGSNFNDTLTGDANANVLMGGLGDDALDGGGGSDTASYASATSAVTVSLATAGAQNTGGAGSDTLVSIENLTGSNFNDTLTGDANANILQGGGGDDNLNGAGGADFASYADSKAAVTVSLAIAGAQNTVGAGTDTLISIEGLIGSRFADQFTAAASGSSLSGGAGNDLLFSGAGNDTFDGGQGVDTVAYTNAASAVTVSLLVAGPQNTIGAGMDSLTSIEKLVGSGFADTLTAGTAGSTLNGGPGGDDLIGGPGSDILNGGGASDFADYSLAAAGVTLNLTIATFQNTVGAGSDELVGIEKIVGSNFNDTITGDAGVNTLYGQAGNDTINGGDAGDYIFGGVGNDTLNGQGGQDNLTGQGGNDVFVFSALADSPLATPDTIVDFTSGQDTINLSAIDADSVTGGDQAFHVGGGGGHAGDIVVHAFDVGHNRTQIDLYVDNNASVDAAIWLTGDHHTLTAADFVL